MRKLLLLSTLALGASAMAQNISDNKVSFSFIQLPTTPIDDAYTTFSVTVEKGWEQSNEDSLFQKQLRIETAKLEYEAAMTVWVDQKKEVDRKHLKAMANWEKQTLAGATVPTPQKPAYPPRPELRLIDDVLLHSDMDVAQAATTIQIEGYQQGSGGATVHLKILPITGMEIVESKKGSGTSTKYNYSCRYSMPIELKVESPKQGIILQETINGGRLSYGMKSHSSKYEHELWYMDNKEAFWNELQDYARKAGLNAVSHYLTEKCGYPKKSRTIEVYTVKKHKDHYYDDMLDAFTKATQGYDELYKERDRSAAQEKLIAAIKSWEKTLEESNPQDNKARINDKITAMLYCNLAEAYMWRSDFDKAEQYINKAVHSGVGKAKRYADDLYGPLNAVKMRWEANYDGIAEAK